MGVCDFELQEIQTEPFPHVVKYPFLDPEFYERFKKVFPTIPKTDGVGRTGYDLYPGDPDYPALLEIPEWREFYDDLHSQRFIDYISQQFPESMKEAALGGETPVYKEFLETRNYLKADGPIPDEVRPVHEVFVRMDVQQGHPGYYKKAHCDYKRRLASLVLYVCDQDETGIEGGEFVLHNSKKNMFGKTQLSEHSRFAPKHNFALIFPRVNTSFHSVTEITSANGPRNFLYVAPSATVPLW